MNQGRRCYKALQVFRTYSQNRDGFASLKFTAVWARSSWSRTRWISQKVSLVIPKESKLDWRTPCTPSLAVHASPRLPAHVRTNERSNKSLSLFIPKIWERLSTRQSLSGRSSSRGSKSLRASPIPQCWQTKFVDSLCPSLQSTPVPAWQLMFNQGLGWFDKPSSLFYTNMFDWMVDAVYFALGAAGFPEMELLIGEVSAE